MSATILLNSFVIADKVSKGALGPPPRIILEIPWVVVVKITPVL